MTQDAGYRARRALGGILFVAAMAGADAAQAQTAPDNSTQQRRQRQAAAAQQQQDEAAARVAERYGVMLDTISIYADRNPKKPLDIAQNVTVIGRQELDERQVRDIQDLVRYEPGVSVAKITSGTDPFGNLGGFTIRGVSNNRVQMLVDGTRVIESIVDGNRDFVNIANLKAVEIIRGPAGVTRGADALGGVVAFVTKDPEDYLKGRNYGGQLDTIFDSYDKSFVKTGSAAVRFGDFAALVSASHRTYSEGTLSKARADGGIYGCPRNPEAIRCNKLNPLDGEDYDILGKLVWTPTKDHEVKFTAEFLNKNAVVDQRYDLGLQTGGIRNLSYIREQEQTRDRFTLFHRYSPDLGWIDQIRTQISHSPQERDFTGVRNRRLANGQFDRLNFLLNYKEEFSEADIQFNSSFRTPFAEHKLTYGVYASLADTDYKRRDTTQNLNTGVVTVANAGGFNFADATTTRIDGFVQDEISLLDKRWILTPGVRFATYELDPRPNPFYIVRPGKEPRVTESEKLVKQIGSIFKIHENVSLVGRYAEGFKMPTSQQLFTSLPNVGTNQDLIPNPDLKPESVKSYEAGIRGEFGWGFFSATFFVSNYTNFIQNFVEVPSISNPGFTDLTYRNLSSVNLHGIEFAGEYRFDQNWSATVALTQVRGTQKFDARSRATSFDGTTPFSGTAGIRYVERNYGFDAQLLATWSQDALARSSPTLFRPGSYGVFDVIVGWSPPVVKGLTLRASVLNIGDARYFPTFTGTTTYANTASTAVAITNPIELRTAPGRTFKVGANYTF